MVLDPVPIRHADIARLVTVDGLWPAERVCDGPERHCRQAGLQ